MDVEKRIIAFVRLGEILRNAGRVWGDRNASIANTPESILFSAVDDAGKHNAWFTAENVLHAIGSLGEMLREDKIRKWISEYSKVKSQKSNIKRIGVIMAGNIPLVGFHDFLCVLMSGNIFLGKLSSDDMFLLPAMAKILIKIEPEFTCMIHFTDKPVGKPDPVSAFIATGSDNSAKYFEYYFRKYPHVIRKHRNGVAILNGNETEACLKNLGKDIFQYFGLGCRNVSKIYIPQDYNLDTFFSAIVDYGDVINHHKYYNNYIYYHSIYLMTMESFLDNNFLMLKEDERIASPVGTLYYERYKSKEELLRKLERIKEKIQCVASSSSLFPDTSIHTEKWKGGETKKGHLVFVPFGCTQSPELWDYADGVDTMEFLKY